MFRGCYFEYNGISSEKYNLKLFYIENDNMKFNSGGDFELRTGTLPYSYEQLYYTKDYSQKPLEFEVEIINPDTQVSKEQMAAIKNWLFGQDGWKDLTLADDTRNYHLKCIFEPGEDITDVVGYRGVRCKIRNISPFWYGDEKEIKIDSISLQSNYVYLSESDSANNCNVFEIVIPNNDYADFVINPVITVNVDKTSNNLSYDISDFKLFTCDATTIEEGKQLIGKKWVYPHTSEISFDISYLGKKGNINSYDTISINTKYAIVESERFPSQNIYPIINKTNPLPIFKMKYGINICRIRYGYNFSSLTIKYTPVYRMGAF